MFSGLVICVCGGGGGGGGGGFINYMKQILKNFEVNPISETCLTAIRPPQLF